MSPAHNGIDNLLNEHDVARVTRLSVASVRRWRLLRQGPRYLKIGSEDLASWLRSRPSGGQQDAPEAR
jgi:hypothetical protein